MTDELETEVSLDVKEGFALGLQYGVMAGSQLDGCEDCSCGYTDDELKEVSLGFPAGEDYGRSDFMEEFRYLLEFYFPQIDEDTLVGRVEICADDVTTAYIRE